MRTRILFSLAAILAAVACTDSNIVVPVTPDKPSGPEEPVEPTEINISFIGSALNTKIAIGEKEGTAYPGIWEEGDALDVYDAASGEKLGVATLQDESIGEKLGSFAFAETVLSGTKLRLVYPSGATGEAVPVSATPVVTVGDKSIADKTFAFSDELTATEDPIEFSLSHVPAVVKVSLSSTAFDGYTFNKLQLYSKDAAIAGSYSSTGYGAAVADSGAKGLIEVTTASTTTISSEAQELWFMAIPAELNEVYVVAYMQKTLTNKSVEKITIPVKFENVELAAGQVNAIPLTNLTVESCNLSWFNPVETRELLSGVTGAGYAYGTQNTVFVTRKRSTAGTCVEIDVRASGEFTKVAEPVSCKIQDIGSGMSRTTYSVASSAVTDGKITVNCENGNNYCSEDTWGSVAICDASNNVLWSFMVQGVFTDEDPVTDVDYGNFKLMDRPLGSTFSNAWMVAHKADVLPNNNKSLRSAWDTNCAYFQWGRKDPFPFEMKVGYTCENITSAIDVSYATKNPTVFCATEQTSNKISWTYDHVNYNLWGTDGHKTIFDPCPKGYKVATKAVYDYVTANNTKDEAKANMAVNNMAVTLPGGGIDCWAYAGILWGQKLSSGSWSKTTRTMSTNTGELTETAMGYWNNRCSKGRGGSFYWYNNVAQEYQNSAQAMAVRCMVDTENL